MLVFKLPDGISHDIQSLIMKLWWAPARAEPRIHWNRWEEMACSKEKGGMGWDLRGFNIALLAKRLHQRPDTLILWIMKAKYYRNLTTVEADVGYNPCFIW
ncbi:hypothetical protein LINGRAHAP2_LOCUS35080 [Linum grandiflorum]